jgi:hypothetical protein
LKQKSLSLNTFQCHIDKKKWLCFCFRSMKWSNFLSWCQTTKFQFLCYEIRNGLKSDMSSFKSDNTFWTTVVIVSFKLKSWKEKKETANLAMTRRNSDDSEALSPERRNPTGGFVSKHFYRQGLLCASHPRPALFFTFLIIFWACFPLLYIPIYSGRTQTFVEKIHPISESRQHPDTGPEDEPPRWRVSQSPEVYIQQVSLVRLS